MAQPPDHSSRSSTPESSAASPSNSRKVSSTGRRSFAAGVSGSGKRPLKLGYLLKREATEGDGSKMARLFCELRGSKLECFASAPVRDSDAADEPEVRKPRFCFELEACVELEALPDNVDESVAKCRLRKRNGTPRALQLTLHGRSKPVVFVADAGGDVGSWLRHLREATWWTDDKPCRPAGCVLVSDDLDEEIAVAQRALGTGDHEVVRILIDGLCHALNSSGSAALLARRSPCALLFKGDTATRTVLEMKRFVQARTGLPAYFQTLIFEDRELCFDNHTLAACAVDTRSVVSMKLKHRSRIGKFMSDRSLMHHRWEPKRVVRDVSFPGPLYAHGGMLSDRLYTKIGPREDSQRQHKAVFGMRLEGHHVFS